MQLFSFLVWDALLRLAASAMDGGCLYPGSRFFSSAGWGCTFGEDEQTSEMWGTLAGAQQTNNRAIIVPQSLVIPFDLKQASVPGLDGIDVSYGIDVTDGLS